VKISSSVSFLFTDLGRISHLLKVLRVETEQKRVGEENGKKKTKDNNFQASGAAAQPLGLAGHRASAGMHAGEEDRSGRP